MRTLSPLYFVLSAIFLLTVDSYALAVERCVLDDSDRLVCVKKASPDIISLSPGTTELLFAAGAGELIVGVDQYSDYPESVKKIPTVGGHPNVSVEAVIAKKPDLVVVWSVGKTPKAIQQIEALGVTTLHLDARNSNDIESAIRRLGIIAGTEEAADRAANQFVERLTALKKQYEQQKPVTVFFEIWRDPLMTISGNQIINSVIRLCGGRNIYENATASVPRVNLESFLSKNPEVILGSDPRGESDDALESLKKYWGRWDTLTAVREKQLFTVPSDLISRPTPRLLDGAEIVCEQLQSVRNRDSNPENPLLTSNVTQ